MSSKKHYIDFKKKSEFFEKFFFEKSETDILTQGYFFN